MRSRCRSALLARIGCALPTIIAVALLLGPIGVTLNELRQDWRDWVPVFAGAARLGPLALNTIGFVMGTLVIAIPAGTAAAVILFRLDVPGRRAGLLLVIGALVLPLYLHAAGWMAALGTHGWLRTAWVRAAAAVGVPDALPLPPLHGLTGAIWVQAWAMVPWVVVAVGIGLVAVEPELEEDALLAAGWARTIGHVTLRRAAGSIGGAAVLIAVLTAGEMTVTDLFGVRTYAEEVYTQFALEAPNAVGPTLMAAGPWVLLVWALLLVLMSRAVRAAEGQVAGSGPWRARRFRAGAWRWPLTGLLVLGLVPVLGVPLASLVWQAGWVPPPLGSGAAARWSPAAVAGALARALNPARSGTVPELAYSLTWGGIGALVTTAVALPLAWAARGGGRRAWWVAMVAAVCLALPGPVVGVSLAAALNRPGLLGWIYDSSWVLVWAYAIRTLPYAVLVIWPLVQMVPAAVLDAAAVDGAGRWRQFWAIQVPLSRPAAAAGFLVAWVLAVDELAASVIVEPPSAVKPISIRIFQMLHFGLERDVAATCLLLVGVVATIALAALLVLRAGARPIPRPRRPRRPQSAR